MLAPCRFADGGCVTGDGARDLQRRYPEALPLAVDFALLGPDTLKELRTASASRGAVPKDGPGGRFRIHLPTGG